MTKQTAIRLISLLRCNKTYFTLVIAPISLMDCNIELRSWTFPSTNDLQLKFLLQAIIPSSGFDKHTPSQVLNFLISLLGKQLAKIPLAMSSVL